MLKRFFDVAVRQLGGKSSFFWKAHASNDRLPELWCKHATGTIETAGFQGQVELCAVPATSPDGIYACRAARACARCLSHR